MAVNVIDFTLQIPLYDTQFVVEETSFYVRKNDLIRLRDDEHQRLFSAQQGGRIDINGVTARGFHIFLKFVSAQRVRHTVQTVRDVLGLAAHYGFNALYNKTERILVNNVGFSIYSKLRLAETFDLPTLWAYLLIELQFSYEVTRADRRWQNLSVNLRQRITVAVHRYRMDSGLHNVLAGCCDAQN